MTTDRPDPIDILLNGEEMHVRAATIDALLAALDLPATKIAVERNLEIVPKSLFSSTPLAGGDRIEIVQFVGGG